MFWNAALNSFLGVTLAILLPSHADLTIAPECDLVFCFVLFVVGVIPLLLPFSWTSSVISPIFLILSNWLSLFFNPHDMCPSLSSFAVPGLQVIHSAPPEPYRKPMCISLNVTFT